MPHCRQNTRGKSVFSGSPGLETILDNSRWRSPSDSMVAHTVSPRVKNWCSRKAKIGNRLDSERRSSAPRKQESAQHSYSSLRVGVGRAPPALRRRFPCSSEGAWRALPNQSAASRLPSAPRTSTRSRTATADADGTPRSPRRARCRDVIVRRVSDCEHVPARSMFNSGVARSRVRR